MSPVARNVDFICLGRAAVDLYGLERGARLEDAQHFAKYLGGSSANVAVGLSRLGLEVAMLTRVGDEHMGRFVREALSGEGVDVSAVRTDPRRLTGLVLLGIESAESFPHIFFRENCADMGLTPADVDAAPFAAAKALAITGTHLSTDSVRSASAARHRGREAARPQARPRHRLPARALGPDGGRRRRRPEDRLGAR